MQLLGQVAFTLTCQFRKVWRHAVAIRAVAGATDGGFGLAGFCITRLYCLTCSMGHAGDAHGQQQTHDQFLHQLIQLRLRVKSYGPGLLAHPKDDGLVILGTAVHAQTTRRHRLETLGHVLHQRLHTFRQPRRPSFLIAFFRRHGELAGMTGTTNTVVHSFRILCSLSAVKRHQDTGS
ncbi:hypothetical protein D9M71_635770 [compost metagenome]